MVARQILEQRVWARVSSYDHQILRPSRSGDDKAVLVVRAAEIQVGSQEPSAACVRVWGAWRPCVLVCMARGARAREVETSAGAWRRV